MTNAWDIVVVGGLTQITQCGVHNCQSMARRLWVPAFISINQAVTAARLGAQVALVACLGTDECDDAIMQQLQRENVEVGAIIRDKSTSTGAAVIHVAESGEKQILAAPNANASLSVDALHHNDILKNTKVLLIQLEVPMETILEAARLAREAGCKIILDPAPAKKLPEEFFDLLNLIKPNSTEAEFLNGIRVVDRNTARKAAETLLRRGVETVAIQAGDEGNLLLWQSGEVWLPKLPVKALDATGAGDAFAAAMAVAFVEAFSWEEAGHFANTAAALTTTKLGAQAARPYAREVNAYLKHNSSPEAKG